MVRAGIPQMVTSLLLGQPYWAYRVQVLGLGPERVKIAKVSESELECKIADLVDNPIYRKNAVAISEQIKSERGIENLCDYVECLLSNYK